MTSSATSLGQALAAVMIVATLYHAGRLLTSRTRHRHGEFDVDLTNAAMGIGMAIMLVGSLTPSAGRRWAILFAIPTLWFIWRSLDSYLIDGTRAVGRPLRQALTCAAMLYMFLATARMASTASPMSDMHSAGRAVAGMEVSAGPEFGRAVTALLLAAMVGVAVWTCTLLGRGHGVAVCASNTASASAPGATVTVTCELAMIVTTVYMLVLML
ncbi:MAG: DUF5134 domain-containing protein [Mycobacteriaceae bacterium]